ncbi:MAG TPA: PilZ domain-containing protein [Vicinamibacteria bacterium]|nr:PilZ domain-containing protein [Vicinamibacteria bacterium]
MTPAIVATQESEVGRPVAVWIEDVEGTIVRGVAESVTNGGAHIRLAGHPEFGRGAGVALRISFDPESPTVAATARVSWIRAEDGQAECGVEWTGAHPGVEEWLASRN